MSEILTVTQAATNRALVSLESIKAELGIEDTESDTLLTRMIREASAAVESYCGRVFALQEYRQDVRLSASGQTLILRQWPIVAVDSVTESGVELTEDVSFEVDGEKGFLHRIAGTSRACWSACGKIRVEYTAGYILPGDTGDDLPADVERAAAELVKLRWFSRDRDPTIARESVPEVYDVTFAGGRAGEQAGAMPPAIAAALDAYRATL